MLRSAVACSHGLRAGAIVRRAMAGGLVQRLMSSTATASPTEEAGWTYDHDVLVVGGGIVGCSLACRLAQDIAPRTSHQGGVAQTGTKNGVSDGAPKRPSVRLVEARPPSTATMPTLGENKKPDPRVYALSPGSVKVLRSLGVWEGGGADGGSGLRAWSQEFRGMQVWDDRGPGFLHFDGDTPGKPLGYVSEHGLLHSALFRRVKDFEAEGVVELTAPAQVKRVAFPPVGKGGSRGPITVTLETAPGKTSDVTCRLLVAADGGDSKVARMLGLSSWGWGYGQRAVVATVRLAGESHGETAFQRYLSRGPLAVLPLKDGLASLVWSTTPEHAELLKSMTEQNFLAELNDALTRPPAAHGLAMSTASGSSLETSPIFPSPEGLFPSFSTLLSGAGAGGQGIPGTLGVSKVVGGVSALATPPIAAAKAVAEGFVKGAEGVAGALMGLSMGLGGGGGGGFSTPPQAVEILTPRLGFDLSLRQAYAYTGARAALVGDAAHTVHPMAGQGLNLGIADADALARAVLEGRLSGTDVGSKTLLSRYEQERKAEALVMMGALDSLHRLFGAEGRAAAAVRSAGLSALNAAGPVKRRLARHAMGGGSLK